MTIDTRFTRCSTARHRMSEFKPRWHQNHWPMGSAMRMSSRHNARCIIMYQQYRTERRLTQSLYDTLSFIQIQRITDDFDEIFRFILHVMAIMQNIAIILIANGIDDILFETADADETEWMIRCCWFVTKFQSDIVAEYKFIAVIVGKRKHCASLDDMLWTETVQS